MAQPHYDDINNLYSKYLGREASQDEYGNWVSGNYGSTELGGIEQQISTSGEAQDYQSRQGGGQTEAPAAPAMNYGDPGDSRSGETTPPANPDAHHAAQPSQPASPSYDDVNKLYTQYLGRPAGQDEYGNWISGAYGAKDLPGIAGQISTSGEAQTYKSQHPTAALTPNPLATFAGFDAGRIDSNTLKYNAMKVLGSFDPNDPTAMSQAYAILNRQSPGQYELDKDGNLMLTGTADGYIGARPIGWGSGGAWYEPSQGQYDWQWLAYNAAHPGPSGEGANIGGAGTGKGTGTGSSQGGASLLSSLQQLLGLGQAYGGPGSPGIFDPSNTSGSNLVQQIGQDPFSQTITGALTQLMGAAGQGLTNATAHTPIDDALAALLASTQAKATAGTASTPIDDALKAYLSFAQGKATTAATPTAIDEGLKAYLDWAQGKATTAPAKNDADAALSALLGSAQGHLTSTPQEQAAAFEKARMPYEMARKVQLGNAADQMANRGLLSAATPGGGQYGGAVDRIETNLAPAYTAALDEAFGQLNQNEQNWAGILNNAVGTDTSRQTAMGNLQQGYGSLWGNALATGNTREQQQQQAARDWSSLWGNAIATGNTREQQQGEADRDLTTLWNNAIATGNTRENQQGQSARDWATVLGNAANAGTNRQTALGDLAIKELSTNNQFTEFLATYGLDRDKAMADIALGQNSQLLQAFQLYLQYGQLAAGGYV